MDGRPTYPPEWDKEIYLHEDDVPEDYEPFDEDNQADIDRDIKRELEEEDDDKH